jgi:hypothetical protein
MDGGARKTDLRMLKNANISQNSQAVLEQGMEQ